MIEIITPSGEALQGSATYTTGLSEIRVNGRAVGATTLSVSYGGTTYTSTDGDVFLDVDGSFVFPNPNVYADGFDLYTGVNTFQIVADKVSTGSPFGTVNIVLVEEVTGLAQPPSGVKMERRTNAVDIIFNHTDTEVSYYNIYASEVSGGGSFGYLRVNLDPIDPDGFGERSETVTEIGAVSSDVSAQEADPLISEISFTQKNNTQDLVTDSLGELEIPEGTTRLRVSTRVSSISLSTKVRFLHSRTAGAEFSPRLILNGRLSSVPATNPIYYVVTSVKVVDGVERESRFSAEVAGKPIPVTPSNTSLPVVSREDLIRDMVTSIYLAQPDVSVQVGSVIRDVVIDPFVSEMERSRFLLDFAYRSSSFAGLLQIDDPQNTGSSITVEDSAYKRALRSGLFLNSDSAVQNLVDGAFEKLASNYGVSRKLGISATGEVQFYTNTRPTFTLSIPVGTTVSGAGVDFLTTREGTIPVDEVSRYYNPVTKRYSITLPISAKVAGTSGNVTSGKITKGAPLGFSVTNASPTFGGQNEESNLQLATRAMGVLSSLDVGTKAGYERVSREIAGVQASFIVGAGDRYMKRDGGLGGKVDVWVRGESLSTVSDVFAPSFNSSFGSTFIPVGSVGSFRFRSITATLENPIYEMINREFYDPVADPNNLLGVRFGLKNISQSKYFDLTGYVIEDYRTIRLSTDIDQPSYSISDTILGDWRTSASSKIVLSRQPVRQVFSALREDGVTSLGYTFNNSADPFLLGGSSLDSASIVLDNPGETLLEISEESHVIVGFYEERLEKLGADPLSIEVKSLDGVVYVGPYASQSSDYTILDDEKGQVSIQRNEGGTISDGETVLISYRYLENITVSYQTNLVISNAQQEVEAQKNITADVVVKEIRSAALSINATVVLDSGYDASSVNGLLQYNLANFITTDSIGGVIRPSEIIKEINNTDGVSHVRLPMTRMSFNGGTKILREEVLIGVGNYTRVDNLSNANVNVWKISSRLLNTPVDGGGENARVYLINESSGVERELTLLDSMQRANSSSWTKDTAGIVGQLGFQAISDGDSKLLIGLALGDDPSEYRVEVSYEVEERVEVISEARLNNFSHFTTGEISFTFEGA